MFLNISPISVDLRVTFHATEISMFVLQKILKYFQILDYLNLQRIEKLEHKLRKKENWISGSNYTKAGSDAFIKIGKADLFFASPFKQSPCRGKVSNEASCTACRWNAVRKCIHHVYSRGSCIYTHVETYRPSSSRQPHVYSLFTKEDYFRDYARSVQKAI